MSDWLPIAANIISLTTPIFIALTGLIFIGNQPLATLIYSILVYILLVTWGIKKVNESNHKEHYEEWKEYMHNKNMHQLHVHMHTAQKQANAIIKENKALFKMLNPKTEKMTSNKMSKPTISRIQERCKMFKSIIARSKTHYKRKTLSIKHEYTK